MKSIRHHKTAVIAVEKNKYYLKITGEGPPLICLHGFSEDHTTWDEIAIPGYTVYRIDLIGHGKSEKPHMQEDYEINTILRQLHQLIHNFTKKQYSIMGYSMGGGGESHLHMRLDTETRSSN